MLHVDGDEMRLELVGGFDLSVSTAVGFPAPGLGIAGTRDDVSTLLGETSRGVRFTLMNCFVNHSDRELSMRAGGFVALSQALIVNQVLKGAHINNLDAPTFHSLELECENLAHFLHRLEPAISMAPTGDAAAMDVDPPSEAFIYDGLTFTSLLRTEGFHPHRLSNRTEVRAISTGRITIRSDEPASYNQLSRYIKPIQDLLTFASGRPSGVTCETLDATTPNADTVEVIRRPVHKPEPDAEFKDWSRFLFTCDDMPASELIPRWLDLRESLGLALQALLGQAYSNDSYLEEKALGVAAAAEGFHKRLYNKLPREPAAFDELLQGMLKGVKDQTDREWIKARFSNTVSLRHRLRDLTSKPDQETVEKIIAKPRIWADRLVGARNAIAHGNGGSASRLSYHDWEVLILETKLLLHLVLMHKLGIPVETQRKLADNGYLQTLRERERLGKLSSH